MQSKSTPPSALESYVPILDWLPNYQKGWLRGDIIAAITVWALVVPEAMAYAGIAGMPPETGLYAAPLALVAYAILGTSRHLSVGPSSTVAALSFSVVAGMAMAGSDKFVFLTIVLALVTGLLLIIFSFLRLGLLADFLSRPVLDGFVVGVALSIAIGQVDKIFGFEPTPILDFLPGLAVYLRQINLTHWPTFAVGVISLGLLFALHKYLPKIPGPLVVLFLSIAVSSLFNFEAHGIHIVGEIPASLPPFGLPEDLSLRQMINLIPGALGVALVAFAESVAIARSLANRFGYEVKADQELLAVGVANIGSGISGGFTVDGSMSRTSAATEAGVNSQMASLIGSVAILITAVALTPLFYNLPEATLGAIVIHAVWHNINPRKITQYRPITRLDFYTAVVSFLGVLLLGMLAGLLLAALLGLVVLLFDTKQRTTAVLGRVPETTMYRNLDNFPEGQTYPGLLILRFDGMLFFANTPNFISAVRAAIQRADPSPRVILVDGESMNGIDATAIVTLKEFQRELTGTGRQIWLARMKTEVLQILERADLTESIPKEHIFADVQDGVDAYLATFAEGIERKKLEQGD